MNYDVRGNQQHVLSVYPTKSGFSFAYFESATNLLDWGNIYAKESEVAEKISTLLHRLNPDVVVSRDVKNEDSKEGRKASKTTKEIYRVCETRSVFTKKYSKSMIKGVFDVLGADTKYKTAQLIITWMPELGSKFPTDRRDWSRKTSKAGIFDAVAFAVAYFYTDT